MDILLAHIKANLYCLCHLGKYCVYTEEINGKTTLIGVCTGNLYNSTLNVEKIFFKNT